jgi:hypothetical protein
MVLMKMLHDKVLLMKTVSSLEVEARLNLAVWLSLQHHVVMVLLNVVKLVVDTANESFTWHGRH